MPIFFSSRNTIYKWVTPKKKEEKQQRGNDERKKKGKATKVYTVKTGKKKEVFALIKT